MLSLLALNNLPLFVVQSIMASMLVVVVIGARFILHARMRRLDVAAVVVVIAALVLIGLGSGEQPAVAPPGVVRAGDARSRPACSSSWPSRSYRSGPGWLLAAIAGLGFSGAAIAARASHHHDGIWATVWQPHDRRASWSAGSSARSGTCAPWSGWPSGPAPRSCP